MNGTVRVSNHARSRAVERSPELHALRGNITELNRRICVEVGAAMRTGRVACSQPRWSTVFPDSPRSHARHSRTQRFVWDADELRCWVVERTAGVWLVVTLYQRREEPAA